VISSTAQVGDPTARYSSLTLNGLRSPAVPTNDSGNGSSNLTGKPCDDHRPRTMFAPCFERHATTLQDRQTPTTHSKNVPLDHDATNRPPVERIASMDPSQQQQQQQQKDEKQHVILFYKYHPLSDDPSVTELYRLALHNLCRDLGLTGRILVGCSSTSEGINGTLAGPHGSVKSFTVALSELQLQNDGGDASDPALLLERAGIDDPHDRRAGQEYWTASREFFDRIGAPVLALQADDFKWSAASRADSEGDAAPASADSALFPDLNVKLVDELIGSGGAMKDVPIQETSKGYLPPEEWHEAISRLDPQHSVLIDCRNNKEYEIGHFTAAVNPHTTVYSQFPHWVEQNQHLMENKTVYMYCTGALVTAGVGIAYFSRDIFTLLLTCAVLHSLCRRDPVRKVGRLRATRRPVRGERPAPARGHSQVPRAIRRNQRDERNRNHKGHRGTVGRISAVVEGSELCV
jgi:UPF0176 acylphosphatase like domain